MIPKSNLPPVVVRLLVAGLFVAGFTASALADVQIKGATQTDVDKRRTQSGARVTAEADSGGDPGEGMGTDHMSDSYQPKGVPLGNFLLMPKVVADVNYVDNTYATRTDAKSDLYTLIQPEVSLRSRFQRHEVNARVQLQQYLYNRFERENRLDISGDVSGRYDLAAGTVFDGLLQLYSRHEDRTSPDDASGLRPTPSKGATGKFGGQIEQGRFTVRAEVLPQRLTYEGVATSVGTIIPNADRNRWEVEGKVRTAYEMFPGYKAVTQLSVNTREYDHTYDRGGYKRSSSGYRAEAGVGFDISQLLRGDVLLGYLAQDYRDSRLTDPHGLSFYGSLNWTPDKLLVIVPAMERAVGETSSAGASSLIRNTGSLLVKYELARNIVIEGYGSVSYETLSGTSQSDWVEEGKLKATYAFSPQLFVGTEARIRNKDATLYGSGYRQNTFTLRLGAQL